MDLNIIMLFIGLLCSYAADAQIFARGADISWLPEMEDSGKVFRDSDGEVRPLLDILRSRCINSVRIRVWVDPQDGLCGQEYVCRLAQRADSAGMDIMIDFHYSDWWADPRNQKIPVAWTGSTISQLEDSVYGHTHRVLKALKDLGISPRWVQIGNETNDGMLWETARATASMPYYARCVSAGHRAAHAVFQDIVSIVHLGSGDDAGLFEWNIGGLLVHGAEFDAVGMSLYPDPDNWQKAVSASTDNTARIISLYRKPVVVSEIGMLWTHPAESKSFVEAVLGANASFGAMGLGVFWWEPQAYGWQGYDKGAWSPDGRPTGAMDGFLQGCSDDCRFRPPR